MALAQQELQTQQSLLSYYAKKEKEYLDFIGDVGTAGTGGGRKGLTDKKFDRTLALAKLKQSVASDKSKRILSVEKLIEDEFSAPVSSNHQAVARQAALNLSAGFNNVDTAIRGLKGFTPGTSQARVVSVQLYSLMEA